MLCLSFLFHLSMLHYALFSIILPSNLLTGMSRAINLFNKFLMLDIDFAVIGYS